MSAPEIRLDQLTGLRTILAPGRAARPDVFSRGPREAGGGGDCPFCEGHEERTPAEVWAHRPSVGEANAPGWTARAVPNLYPAFAPQDDASPVASRQSPGPADPLAASRRSGEADLFGSKPALGAHEVIVNAPEHEVAMCDLDEERFVGAIAAWRERIRAHRSASYVQLIVNEGGGAGASLEHTHAQLYALPFVPTAVARERERFHAYRERTGGGDLLGDILAEEVRRRERLVVIDDEAALICPWASRSPFELRVVPRAASADFGADESGAAMIRTALLLLARRFGGPPELNLWVRTAPRGADAFRWHVDIAPRLTVKAGFELATGVDIDVYPPEQAAADLRETLEAPG